MSFSEAIQSVYHQYANFHGRARRAEYWYFMLLCCIVNAAISIITSLLPVFGTVLSYIWALAVLVPNLAVMTRRLHDIDKSGLNILFILIPLVGVILLIVWLAKDSQPGTNQYGVSVKYPNGQSYSQGGYNPPYSNHSPTSNYQQPQYQQPQYQQPQYQQPQYQQPQYQQPQYQQPQAASGDDSVLTDLVQQEYDATAETGIVCPFCGAKNVATAKFCTTCGTTLDR